MPRLLLALLWAASLPAVDGTRDPEFAKVPFDQWFTGGDQTPLKWTEHTLPTLLSVHQRLMTRLRIQLDGAEAAKRKGEGQLFFMFQITDSHGRIYQDHTTYDLAKVEDGMKAQDLSITESVFVLPGDYSVAMAIYDTASKEHSTRKTKLRIAPLKLDPLPEAWNNLPPVEFVEPSDPPDHWYLPKEQGRLDLPVKMARPARMEVLVNLTPTEEHTRNYGIQDRNLSLLIPTLKVMSEMAAPGLEINVRLVDLSRRKVTYKQDDVHELNWEKIKASFPQSNSASIDVKSLSDRRHNAAYLGSEIERSFAAGGKEGHAVVVLSGPMVFESGQEFEHPLVKPCVQCKLFYIRVQMPSVRPGMPDLGRRRGMGPVFPGRVRSQPPDGEPVFTTDMDQLAPLLRTLEPHVYDAVNAEQIRKALANIVGEMAGL